MHHHSDVRGSPPDEDVDDQQREEDEAMISVDTGASTDHNTA